MNVKKSTAIASAMTGLLALGAQFIAAPAMAADDKEKCYGVVKAGKKESTASIAQRYRVSVADVANWNDVSAGAAFKVGQQVVLYLPVRAGKGRASASASGAGKQAASSGSRSSASNAKAVTPSKRGGTPSKKKR